eukprot:gene10464-biopygen11933
MQSNVRPKRRAAGVIYKGDPPGGSVRQPVCLCASVSPVYVYPVYGRTGSHTRGHTRVPVYQCARAPIHVRTRLPEAGRTDYVRERDADLTLRRGHRDGAILRSARPALPVRPAAAGEDALRQGQWRTRDEAGSDRNLAQRRAGCLLAFRELPAFPSALPSGPSSRTSAP